MYEYVKGVVKEVYKSYIVLEIGDIGYEIFLIKNNKVKVNDHIKIYIYNYINESLNIFFGFYKIEEKNIFIKLLKVKNIGIKTAYIILDRYDIDILLNEIRKDNDEFLLSLPKINKNNLNDLKSKLKDNSVLINSKYISDELFNILKNLDYDVNKIIEILPNVEKNISLNERLKKAIHLLSEE